MLQLCVGRFEQFAAFGDSSHSHRAPQESRRVEERHPTNNNNTETSKDIRREGRVG